MRATCGCLVEDGMVLHAFDGPCAIPRPTTEDYCASGGHVYVADEWPAETVPTEHQHEVGRCYCGQVRYPAGGPDSGRNDNA